MIEFQELKFKNVLSYGNNYTTIKFKEGISRYFGKNGDGKSTPFLDCMWFALFGKPYRAIKKSLLINAKNKKELEVYLTYKKQDDDFRIERGIKPDFFRIYKNDQLIPVSSSVKGYQEILEEDILQFNENITSQLAVKSLTKNMAFMTLSKAEKRKIIENILDIEVFSIMGKNLKVKVDAVELELKSLKKDVDNTDLLIDQEQENLIKLHNLKKKMEEESNQNIQIYKDEIKLLNEENDKYNKGLIIIEKKKKQKIEKSTEVVSCRNAIVSFNNTISKLEAKLEMNVKKIKFLNSTCSGCPKINEIINDDDMAGVELSIKDQNLLLQYNNERLAILESEMKKINDILANERLVLETLSRNKRRIIELESHITKSKSSIIEIDESKLKGYKVKKKSLELTYNKQSNVKTHLVLLRSLCSDDGIKTFIIKKYLPTINKLLNTYLTKFQTDIIFNFDVEFNEVVLTKYKEDFTYESFSQGQKKRIDLAVMFAFIKFAQMKNKKSDTNLLILDEVLTSLDQQGTESVMEVLSDYRDKNNKCIITINHLTDISQEFFDYSYKVTMEKGFSKITETQI